MKSNYEFRKSNVCQEIAERLFSQDFATKAFEKGLHRKRGRPAANGEQVDIPPSLIRWIKSEGRSRLAICCLAYLFAIDLTATSKAAGFEDLLRKIREAAREIGTAADTIATQLGNHILATGEWEPARTAALSEMSRALLGPIPYLDDSPVEGNLMPDLRVQHGLSRCWKLADEVDDFLPRFRALAREARRNGDKPLKMSSRNRTDRDRDGFIADLESIYVSGLRAALLNDDPTLDPSTKDGLSEGSPTPSPFVRFVWHAFEEIKEQCLDADMQKGIKRPSSHVIGAALSRSRAMPS